MDSAIVAADAALLPDATRWGQGFGARGYTAADLDEIAGNVAETSQPGYGARLFTWTSGYVRGEDGLRAVLPGGFDATGHPNRATGTADSMDPELITGTAEVAASGVRAYGLSRGWVLDQHGRPLHPHHAQLLGDERIGMPTGLGYGWWMGETVVADAVVTAAGHVLLTTRETDQGTIPSLPGGYSLPADYGRSTAQWLAGNRRPTADGVVAAAARRARAETGLDVPDGAAVRFVRGIRPISSPHTLHAWTVTITVHVRLGDATLPTLGDGGTWTPISEVDSVLDRMWPDHRRALVSAVD